MSLTTVQQQQPTVLSASQLLPNTSFMTSQPRFVTSTGGPAQAVLVKIADGKTVLATAAPGQLVRHIRPVTVQSLQQQQQLVALPTAPIPSMKLSAASPQQTVVIPASVAENGEQQHHHLQQQQQLQPQPLQQQQLQPQQLQQQLFRVPVSTATSGAVFIDASKQTHVIPQAVLVSWTNRSKREELKPLRVTIKPLES
jgi:hypothetical protein